MSSASTWSVLDGGPLARHVQILEDEALTPELLRCFNYKGLLSNLAELGISAADACDIGKLCAVPDFVEEEDDGKKKKKASGPKPVFDDVDEMGEEDDDEEMPDADKQMDTDDDDGEGGTKNLPDPDKMTAEDMWKLGQTDEMLAKHAERAKAERERVQREFEDKLFVPARAEEARKYANELFKGGKLNEAADAYERLLKMGSAFVDRATLLSNLAAVRVKQWRWRDALVICDHALEADGTANPAAHVKAYYRMAQAHRGLKELDQAMVSIRHARRLEDRRPNADLDALEAHIKKDMEKQAAEAHERAAADARAAARMGNTREVQAERAAAARRAQAARRQALREAALASGGDLDHEIEAARAVGASAIAKGALPTGGGAAASKDLGSWLRAALVRRLMREEATFIIQEEDAVIEVTELPSAHLDCDAAVLVGDDGRHSLYFDLSLRATCRCTHMRHKEGALQFFFHATVADVTSSSAATPDAWACDAQHADPSQVGLSRVDRLIAKFIRTRYLTHLRQEVGDVLAGLRQLALARRQASMPTEDERSRIQQEDELVASFLNLG